MDKMMDLYYPLERLTELMDKTGRKVELLGVRGTGKTFVSKQYVLKQVELNKQFVWGMISSKSYQKFNINIWKNGLEGHTNINLNELTYTNGMFYYQGEIVGKLVYLGDVYMEKTDRLDNVTVIVIDEYNHPTDRLKNKMNELIDVLEGTYKFSKTILIGNTDTKMSLGVHDENGIREIKVGINEYKLKHNKNKIYYIIDYIAFNLKEAEIHFKDDELFWNSPRNSNWKMSFLGELKGQSNRNVNHERFNLWKWSDYEYVFYHDRYYYFYKQARNQEVFIYGLPEGDFEMIDFKPQTIYTINKRQNKAGMIFWRELNGGLWQLYQENLLRYNTNATKDRLTEVILS